MPDSRPPEPISLDNYRRRREALRSLLAEIARLPTWAEAVELAGTARTAAAYFPPITRVGHPWW